MREQPLASDAERDAQRDLSPAAERTRQHQVGDIRAGDEQHEEDGAKHRPQGRPDHWTDQILLEGLCRRAESGIAFYMTRPWIPFALLRVGPIRETLAAGASFMHRLVLNDFPQIPAIGRLLWHRFRIPGLRQIRLRSLDSFRCEYEGHKPSYVFFDTGAQIHEVLTQRGFSFGDVGAAIPYWSIRHLQGVTRDVLCGPTHDACSAAVVEPIVLEKLKEYGIQEIKEENI